jgi:metal-responsive CopG/Arc/MetJ family transcriptional regulator
MKNSKGGKGLAREERLQIMLAPEELKAVDNFRFEHRMPSRAAAVRELLRHGLGAVGAVIENTGVRSGSYNVLKAPPKGPGRSSLS